MGPEGFSKIWAGKDTLPALPVIFQIGAGMVGPEWYRAGTSETQFTTITRAYKQSTLMSRP